MNNLIEKFKREGEIALSADCLLSFKDNDWMQLCQEIINNKENSTIIFFSSFHRLNKIQCNQLFEAIQKAQKVNLCLSNNIISLDAEVWRSFCKVIKTCKKLELSLSWTNLHKLPGTYWQQLCEAIEDSRQLSIDLQYNYLYKLDEDSLAHLFHAIEYGKQLSLNLSVNGLSVLKDRSWQQLCKAIKNSKQLEIDLAYENFADLSENRWRELYEAIQYSQQLSIILCLNKLYQLNEERWQQLCAIIQFGNQLTINLENNSLGLLTPKKWEELCSAIRLSKRLKIKLSVNSLDGLQLTYWHQLCDAIQYSQHLSISLGHNNLHLLSDDHWHQLCHAIQHSHWLSINLRSNSLYLLSDKNWELLCDAIMRSQNLTINLSWNFYEELNQKRLQQLHKAIHSSRNLSIKLTGNKDLSTSEFKTTVLGSTIRSITFKNKKTNEEFRKLICTRDHLNARDVINEQARAMPAGIVDKVKSRILINSHLDDLLREFKNRHALSDAQDLAEDFRIKANGLLNHEDISDHSEIIEGIQAIRQFVLAKSNLILILTGELKYLGKQANTQYAVDAMDIACKQAKQAVSTDALREVCDNVLHNEICMRSNRSCLLFNNNSLRIKLTTFRRTLPAPVPPICSSYSSKTARWQ